VRAYLRAKHQRRVVRVSAAQGFRCAVCGDGIIDEPVSAIRIREGKASHSDCMLEKPR
jgi:hypothetical protein